MARTWRARSHAKHVTPAVGLHDTNRDVMPKRTNLVRDPTRFVGRDAELTALGDLLAEHPLVSLRRSVTT